VGASLRPDGVLVSSSEERTLRIWSRANPGQIVLQASASWTPAIFTPGSSRVFTSLHDPNFMEVSYDLDGPIGAQPLPFFPWQFAPYNGPRSPDGGWYVSGGIAPRHVLFYPLRGLWPFRVDLGVTSIDAGAGKVRISPDGRRAAVIAGSDLVLVDLSSQQLAHRVVFHAPEGRVLWTTKFDPTGELLVVGTFLSGAWVVPLGPGEPHRLPDSPACAGAVAFAPGGDRLAVGGCWDCPAEQRFARVLDREGRLLARLEAGSGEIVHDLEFLTDTTLVVAGGSGLRWWDTETGEARLLGDGTHDRVAVSLQGIVARNREGVWVYDRSTLAGRLLPDLDAPGLSALAIAPDGRSIATGTRGGAIRVRHLAEDRAHFIPGPGGLITSLQIDPRGHWITAVTNDGEVGYWPVPRGRPLHDRPLAEFLAILRAQTNLRVIVDPGSAEGYRESTLDFPGWRTVPVWQEWYSDEYMRDPPWTPMLDRAAILAVTP
jgi:WD40 repeat protein